MDITSLGQLNPDLNYTHVDYLSWQCRERVELILGRIFPMAPAAGTPHQHCSRVLTYEFSRFFGGSDCLVFHAPFDVFFVGRAGIPDTVVQPDLVVLCDRSKLTLRGCFGAPDLVVEIVSPGSIARDLHEKFAIYESNGVREYWIIQPVDKTVTIHTLQPNGKYRPMKMLTVGDTVESPLFPGLAVDLQEAFRTLILEPEMGYVVRV